MLKCFMSFEEIFFYLNSENSNYFYEYLKQSKDPKCKEILVDLILGKNLYISISKHGDSIGKIILSTQKTFSLLVFGQYLTLKNKMKKKILGSLSYPLLLCFFSLISMIIISYIIKINFFEIIFGFLFILLLSIFSFYKIFNKFIYILKIQLIIEFFNNNLSLKEMKNIWIIFKIKIPNIDFRNQEHLISVFLNQSFENYYILNQFYKNETENFNNYCDKIVENNSKFSLIFIALYISYFFFKSIFIIFSENSL